MRELSEMPEEGQFVAVWEYNGKIWSDTYYWEDDKLLCFSNESEEFEIQDHELDCEAFVSNPAKFYVID